MRRYRVKERVFDRNARVSVRGGIYGQAGDAAVAFDAKHNVWLISSPGINGSAVNVLTSRSVDGGLTWSNPVTTATGSLDKNWIVCDDTASSPHYGNCCTEYDISGSGDSTRMKTSTDGGTSWSTSTHLAGPMNLSWIPNTSQGRMFGDYISTSVRAGANAVAPRIASGIAR